MLLDQTEEIVPKTRAEIEIAAGLIGIRSGTIRQWFHRRRIPPLAQLQLIQLFGRQFMVTDYPIDTSGRPCLANLHGNISAGDTGEVRSSSPCRSRSTRCGRIAFSWSIKGPIARRCRDGLAFLGKPGANRHPRAGKEIQVSQSS